MPKAPALCTKGLVTTLMFTLASVCALAQPASAFKDVVYAEVDGKALGLDIYLPANAGAAPLLVYVHGGAWRAGTKEAQVPLEFVAAGYALASLDFRQTPEAPFPANLHDIKAGIRFLRAHADQYGYDADKIAIAGASSGAHLAVLAGVTNGHAELEGSVGDYLDTSSDVQAILSYFAATDLTTILSQSTPFGVGLREPALTLLLGALPDQAPELAQLASPVYHVDANDPPLLLLHGDRDPQMPVNQSLQMLGSYEAQGLDASFIPVHGAVHGGPEFFNAKHLDQALAFLRRTLKE
jgi:acetyl esterase/lipase